MVPLLLLTLQLAAQLVLMLVQQLRVALEVAAAVTVLLLVTNALLLSNLLLLQVSSPRIGRQIGLSCPTALPPAPNDRTRQISATFQCVLSHSRLRQYVKALFLHRASLCRGITPADAATNSEAPAYTLEDRERSAREQHGGAVSVCNSVTCEPFCTCTRNDQL